MTIHLNILQQSDDWVIVSKPPKLLMHGHPRFPGAATLIDTLQEQLSRQLWIVHRLDRSASGVLIVAKRKQVTQSLKEALATGTKTYVAFVRGYFSRDEAVVVETPIKHNGRFKEAKSVITCLGRSHEPRCSLLQVQPHTGRHHQVRRHVRDLTVFNSSEDFQDPVDMLCSLFATWPTRIHAHPSRAFKVFSA